MSFRNYALSFAGLLALSGSLFFLRAPLQPVAGVGAMTVPAGFEVELVAAPPLVAYPMLGTIDPQGRLFLCESSGITQTNDQMRGQPGYRIRLLEDEDGDGVYDTSKVFADRLTLPAGAVWHAGSLYVASPPDLIRFDDTNGDGVADKREVVLTGWNLSSNAASLHGPFFGPDGYLYLTDGRHGFDIKTRDGRSFKGRTSRIWRAGPDGTGLEWIAAGGFDNPVELAFTPAGEIIGTMTYFTDPKDGLRDALLHFVEGGAYPKPHPYAAELKRTGDWMPVMSKFARIAPSGLVRYRAAMFGPDYSGNLFSAQFNPHRVQRHKVFRDGATFRTEDEDFLASVDPDFHPTDVMEDADGSLLVIDTGAWFIHGCPISRIAKPEIKGAVYRVRRKSARPPDDPRGDRLGFPAMAPAQAVALFADPRPFVRDRAVERAVVAGDLAVAALAEYLRGSAPADSRAAAVFALFRIGTPSAREAVRAVLDDREPEVRIAAARCAGMATDHAASSMLLAILRDDAHPAVRRQAAAALGQIADPATVPALLSAAETDDRFIEHSAIYSLILVNKPEVVRNALRDGRPAVRNAALIALDQMDSGRLQGGEARAFLDDSDPRLRRTALWVVSRHPEWSAEDARFLRARVQAPRPDEAEPVREAIIALRDDPAIQAMIAGLLAESAAGPAQRLFMLETMRRLPARDFPPEWLPGLRQSLDYAAGEVRLAAVRAVLAHRVAGLDDRLARLAENLSESEALRLAAIEALVVRAGSSGRISDSAFDFLIARLASETDAVTRQTAARVLGRAVLTGDQLLRLAPFVAEADPLVSAALVDAFARSNESPAGKALVAALDRAPAALATVGADRLKKLVENYPPEVQGGARPLFAKLEDAQRARVARLRKLEPLLSAGGDVARGRTVFFGKKVACASCHTIGAEGGHVGPDLTGVGAIRSGHDLLEAIVFPSESFVPGFEIYTAETANDRFSGVRGESDSQTVALITGPGGEVRIPRKEVKSMKASRVSLMPEGLDQSLTQTELIDLLAFLQAQKSRPPR